MIYNNILELIGKTPLVKLQKINQGEAEIALKLEFYNPSGSVKDRAAFYMLNEAKIRGLKLVYFQTFFLQNHHA